MNNVLVQWQTANSRLALADGQVEALRAAVLSTERLMEHSGASGYLELLAARQSLLQAELSQTNDRFDKIQGVINLYHALGGAE